MCCIITTLVFLGPRAAAVIWYLIEPLRFNQAFDTFLLPCLGFVFLPWTLLAYVAAWTPVGVQSFGWVIVGLGVLADFATYAGGGYGNRSRLPGYS